MVRAATRVSVVDDTESRANEYDTKTAAAGDTYPGSMVAFAAPVSKIEIFSRNEGLTVKLVKLDGTTGDEFEVSRNSFRDWKFRCQGFFAKNTTAGAIATYEVTGFYNS